MDYGVSKDFLSLGRLGLSIGANARIIVGLRFLKTDMDVACIVCNIQLNQGWI